MGLRGGKSTGPVGIHRSFCRSLGALFCRTLGPRVFRAEHLRRGQVSRDPSLRAGRRIGPIGRVASSFSWSSCDAFIVVPAAAMPDKRDSPADGREAGAGRAMEVGRGAKAAIFAVPPGCECPAVRWSRPPRSARGGRRACRVGRGGVVPFWRLSGPASG